CGRAADVIQLDEVGQLSGGRRLDLARVLPERRRDPGKVQGGVDRFLGLGGDGGAVFEQPVLVQEPPSVDGALAQGDVVGFRAGEVEDGSAEVLGATARTSTWSPVRVMIDVLVSPWP